MRNHRAFRTSVALLAVVVAGAAFAACGSSSSSSGSSSTTKGSHSEPVTLRLGYFPNVTHAPALVGIQGGIFKKNLGKNVTLETKSFNAGGDVITALFAGELDASFIGPGPVDQRVPEVQRQGAPHRLRRDLGRRLPRREARHQAAPRT